MKAFAVRAPWWLKVASVSGFLATVVYIFYSPVPITPVESEFWFAFKIIATVLGANAVGVALYVLRKRRSA